jgi:hypothetical protein
MTGWKDSPDRPKSCLAVAAVAAVAAVGKTTIIVGKTATTVGVVVGKTAE